MTGIQSAQTAWHAEDTAHVFINALVGFVQEGKAERALDAIRTLLAPNATVTATDIATCCRRVS